MRVARIFVHRNFINRLDLRSLGLSKFVLTDYHGQAKKLAVLAISINYKQKPLHYLKIIHMSSYEASECRKIMYIDKKPKLSNIMFCLHRRSIGLLKPKTPYLKNHIHHLMDFLYMKRREKQIHDKIIEQIFKYFVCSHMEVCIPFWKDPNRTWRTANNCPFIL